MSVLASVSVSVLVSASVSVSAQFILLICSSFPFSCGVSCPTGRFGVDVFLRGGGQFQLR